MAAERGAAALLLLLFVLLAAVSFFLAGRSGSQPAQARQQAATMAMARAKSILLAYTVMYADNYPPSGAGPGHLPCPDTSNNGSPNPPCGPGAMGRLPRAIPLPSGEKMALCDHGDGYDQRIWYAVSAPHRNNPAGEVNSETAGGLSLDGAGGVAAVLIAPGEGFPGQNRPSLSGVDYLEEANALGPPHFVSLAHEQGNDHVLAIRSNDFMPLVERRVLGVLRDLLRQYRAACNEYPWPVPYENPRTLPEYAAGAGTLAGLFPLRINSPANPGQDEWNSGCAAGIGVPAWLAANGWPRLSLYALASAEVQAGGSCLAGAECLVVRGTDGALSAAEAVVLLAGAELAGQNRGSFSGLADYFEGDNSSGGKEFESRRPEGLCNDRILIVR